MNSVQRVTDFVAPSPKWDFSFNPLLPSRLRDLFGRRELERLQEAMMAHESKETASFRHNRTNTHVNSHI